MKTRRRGMEKGGGPRLAALLAGFGLGLCASAQNCLIDWCSLDAGACVSTSAVCTVSGIIGQPDAWQSASTNCVIAGGFWGMLTPGAVAAGGAPVLKIVRSSVTAVTVSWPAPAPGWVLQESASLAKGQWLTVVAPLTQVSGRMQSVQPLGNGRYYRLSQVAGVPWLTVQTNASNTLVSWPAPATGWALERYPALGGGGWSLVGTAPTQVGELMEVALPLSAANDYYQLVEVPALGVSHGSGKTLVLSWPGWGTGWALQQSPTLAVDSWTAATNAPWLAGTNLQVTVSSPIGRMFYRLKQQ